MKKVLSFSFLFLFFIAGTATKLNAETFEINPYYETGCPSREDYREIDFVGGVIKYGCNQLTINEQVTEYRKPYPQADPYRAWVYTEGYEVVYGRTIYDGTSSAQGVYHNGTHHHGFDHLY